MSTTHKRTAQTLLAASALVAGVFLTGCSGDSSAASSDDPKKPDASPTSPFDQALAFSQCMRENGVSGFPDPQKDAGGGIALTPGGDVDPNSAEFQSATEACRDKMPQGGQLGGGGGGGEPLDSAKVSAWAKCMRENGLPKLPDPEINGGNMALDFGASGIDPGSDEFQKARIACQDKWPGGGLTGSGGGA